MKRVNLILLTFLFLFSLPACNIFSGSGEKDGGTDVYYLTEDEMVSPGYIPEHNTEEYDRIYENQFLDVLRNPLSTFSIDVDAASYSNVRRYLNNNEFPPKDAVRTEELINYFNYDYPDPKGDEPFSITTEITKCPWNKDHKLVMIGLQGKKVEVKDIPASNLVFLIDVSGSMDYADKLPLLVKSFRLLTEQLRPQDRVAIVVYAGAAGVVLPSTPGDQKKKILDALDQLQAGGSTAGGEGIKLAYRVAKENFITGGNNRVILASDGDFNVGVSSDAEMERLIEEKRNDGVFLSVLGFGTGNLKDSKMEKIADKGNGHYAYIDNLLEAKKVLVQEMGGTLLTIAKDVKIQVEFNPANVQAYRLIGYENRLLAKEDFNDDKKDAGDLGAGHTVTALYEVIPVGVEWKGNNVDELKYQKPQVDKNADATSEMMTVKLRYKQPDQDSSQLLSVVIKTKDEVVPEKSSQNLEWAGAVAQFAMLLRESDFKGNATYEQLISAAKAAKGDDPHGYRAEFIRLAETAELLAKTAVVEKDE